MTITELIRKRTISPRDSLTGLDHQLEEARSEFEAADARVKRSGTEISKCRDEERRCKRVVEDAGKKIEEAERVLDDLERKRQEALDVFLRLQREQDEAAQMLAEARSATQSAQTEIRQEQNKAEQTKKRIEKLRGEREAKYRGLRQVLLQTLDDHMKWQADRLVSTFKTCKEQADTVRAYDTFRAARHSDPDISSMCEQREELQNLLSTAMVPSVRQMLQTSLQEVEAKIEQRFPGALAPRSSQQEGALDDLLYYCDADGKATILIPVPADVWASAKIDEPSDEATYAMRLAWSLLSELKLKKEDGQFVEVRGWVAFQSQFDMEDIAILQDFCLKRHGIEVLRYILSAAPAEVREAILNEDQDI